MKKQNYLTKIFAPLLVVLIATSFFGAFSALVAGQKNAAQDNTLTPIPARPSTQPLDAGQTAAAQDKAMNFIENVLSVDLSKYTIELKISSIMDGVPLANDNRKITDLMYALTPLEGNGDEDVIEVIFIFEKDVLTTYFTSLLPSKVITNTQYANRNDAVKGFLEKYQTYTNIDSTNLIAMLGDVDLTKNSIITKGNTKLEVSGTDLKQTYTVNGVDYTKLEIGVIGGFVRSVYDTRGLYTIGDTSVNISMEQAVDIAIKNLASYSYEMPDGSIVQNFKVNKDATMAKLAVVPVDYVLRPYWDVRMYLDEVYPGNVFAITAFIWANTGEIISYSNMATGGTYAIDDINVSGAESQSSSPDNMISIVVAVVAVTVGALAIGLVVKKRHR
ncbi:MAG: hypothetical protein NWE95_09490 [Candidatus Bathyarchaeota archaeon]|nr:hypothetical protein [Candidatus Bathyarchaeota archaeon]